jgi:hypothetical protein
MFLKKNSRQERFLRNMTLVALPSRLAHALRNMTGSAESFSARRKEGYGHRKIDVVNWWLLLRTLVAVFFLGTALAQSVPRARPSPPLATVPFELAVNHVYVQACLSSSRRLSTLIDSGAPQTMIDRPRSIQFGLAMSGDIPVPGFGSQEPTVGQKTTINRISVYGAEWNNFAALSVPLDFFSQLVGHATDAVIGSDLLSKYVVEVDYLNRVLRLYDPVTYVEPREGCQLPLLWDIYPMVHAQLIDRDDKLVDAVFILDTGSNFLLFTKSFGDAHSDLPIAGKTIDAPTRKMLSGVTRLRVGRVRAVKLGECIVQGPIVLLSQDHSGLGANFQVGNQTISGSIGMNILQQFTTILDYRHHLVTFKRNTNKDSEFQYDMTGIHILAGGSSFHEFTIDQVLSVSPAERKGIRAGDRIELANDVPATQLTVDDLNNVFQRSGSLRLTISRNGKELKKKLKLKPLI